MSENNSKKFNKASVEKLFATVVSKTKKIFSKETANKAIAKVKKVFSKGFVTKAAEKIKQFFINLGKRISAGYAVAKGKVTALFKKDGGKKVGSHEKAKPQSKLKKTLVNALGTVIIFFVKLSRKIKAFFNAKKKERQNRQEVKLQEERIKSHAAAKERPVEKKPVPVTPVKKVSKPASSEENRLENEKTKTAFAPKNRAKNKTEADSGDEFIMPIPEMNRLEKRASVSNSKDDDYEEEASIWKDDRRPFFMVSIGVLVCKISVVLVMLVGFACLGIGLGVLRAYIASAPELDIQKIENNDRTSFIYDGEGELITEYYNLENRSWVSYDEIPTMLKYAVVASEDETFFEHSGFNFKRIVASFLSNVSGDSVSGGSTITQQVLKLTLLTSQQTYKRKIQEIYLAYQLEKEYSKEEILEWYMNIMPMGGLLYGVKSAAKDYFGKELDELTLRECAVLAGATNAPTMYNPRLCMLAIDDGGFGDIGRERLYKRANYVLTQMYAVDFITEEQYNDALFDITDMETEQLKVIPVSMDYTYDHKYYVEYVLDEIVDRIMDSFGWEDDIGREQAHSYLRVGGLQIYTAFNETTQTQVENAVYSYKNWPPLDDPSYAISGGGIEQPQCAAVVIDNATGYIAGIVGGRTEPTIRMGLNRAYQSVLALGSCIKPLSVYAPALDQGLLSDMVIENIPVYIDGWQSPTGYPQNFDKLASCKGPQSVSNALMRSFNIPTARILLDRLGVNTSLSYLRAMNFAEEVLSEAPSDLSLGSKGGFLIDSTAAFATFANNGIYREPMAIIKIVDRFGETIFDEDNQETKRIFKSSTAYIISQWLVSALQKPSSPILIELNNKDIQIAGKTGTNELRRGIGFIGFSRYYTCGLWIGHDDFIPNFAPEVSAMYYATPLWKAVMNAVHDDLEGSKIYPNMDDDVIEVTVCAVSGKLPNGDLCEHDQAGYGLTTELFIRGTEPTQVCDEHIEVTYCKESGLLANQYCTEDCKVTKVAVILDPESEYLKLTEQIKNPVEKEAGQKNYKDKIDNPYEYMLYQYFPLYYVNGVPNIGIVELVVDEKTGESHYEVIEVKVGAACYCSIHSELTNTLWGEQKEMRGKAEELIEKLEKSLKLSKYADNMSMLQKEQIKLSVEFLEEKVNAPLYSDDPAVEIYSTEEAQLAYDALVSLSDSIILDIDEKLKAKSDYAIAASTKIPTISEKLISAKYAEVITPEEIDEINGLIAQFNEAFEAPIASDDETVVLFDIETVDRLLRQLENRATELFSQLDGRLEANDKGDDDFALTEDENTAVIGDEISSDFALVIDVNTGRIIASKLSDMRIAPADMTTIMTAIVAYEYITANGIDINTTTVMFTQEIVDFVASAGLPSAGFAAGEVVCLRDVFYAMLFESGADAAVVLAQYCYGTEAAFVNAMNTRASNMGLENTHFINCTGLSNGNHYTTAQDIAEMLVFAHKYDFINAVMKSASHTYDMTNVSATRIESSDLYNYRLEYNSDISASEVGVDGLGGKTAYSGDAGYCVATYANGANGSLAVILGGADTPAMVIGDMVSLYTTYAG